mmetsp:Transcript_26848/g.81266  ORF Transcript_26848/g.81266 Transcript_26848/m.81266 type:complete len:113 (-) Transcript_26848:1655-1993(-)|eukprot:scaffold272693_cov35-Tisochrysis_lutea.AAC.1
MSTKKQLVASCSTLTSPCSSSAKFEVITAEAKIEFLANAAVCEADAKVTQGIGESDRNSSDLCAEVARIQLPIVYEERSIALRSHRDHMITTCAVCAGRSCETRCEATVKGV